MSDDEFSRFYRAIWLRSDPVAGEVRVHPADFKALLDFAYDAEYRTGPPVPGRTPELRVVVDHGAPRLTVGEELQAAEEWQAQRNRDRLARELDGG